MDAKPKIVKQVYIHKAPNTMKVEPESFSSEGASQSLLHYKRLVVPSNMRSIYWKCYGFPANDENEILTRTKIVCLLCKAQMTYNRNTTNLRMHLQNKHKAELAALEVIQPLPSNKTGKIDKRSLKRGRRSDQIEQGSSEFPEYVTEIDESDPLSAIVKEATGNHSYSMVDGKPIADVIAEFVVMDMQNPEVVEGRGFQRLIGTLKSPCEIPKKNYLSEDVIPSLYENVRQQVLNEVSTLQNTISLSVEDWLSLTGETYSTVSLHYICNTEDNLQSRVLTSIYCSDLDESFWGQQFDAMLEEYKISVERIRAVVVASNRDDVLQSLQVRGYPIIPCFSHLLQELCTKCVFKKTEVCDVLKKCRAFIAHVYRNASALAELRMQDNLLQLEENPIVMDNKLSWMSTLNMLEQIQMRREVIPSVIDNMASTMCPTTSLEFMPDDWKIIDDVINILSPFKVTIATLVEEKCPLISILKPIMCQLLSVHLEPTDLDSTFTITMKSHIAQYLTEKYQEETINELFEISSALDPRFKNLPFLSEEDRTQVRSKLIELLFQVVNVSGSIEDKSPSKKKVSGMEYLLGELVTVKTEMPTEQKADLELTQYEWEPQADLEKSPVDWWREYNGKCFHVYQLACEYLCVPVCVRSHLQQTLTPSLTLQTLAPHLAVKIKYLNTNFVPTD